jgi:hypothetical protein
MAKVSEILEGDVIAYENHQFLVEKVSSRIDLLKNPCIDWELADLCHKKSKWMTIGDDFFDFEITLVSRKAA